MYILIIIIVAAAEAAFALTRDFSFCDCQGGARKRFHCAAHFNTVFLWFFLTVSCGGFVV